MIYDQILTLSKTNEGAAYRPALDYLHSVR